MNLTEMEPKRSRDIVPTPQAIRRFWSEVDCRGLIINRKIWRHVQWA